MEERTLISAKTKVDGQFDTLRTQTRREKYDAEEKFTLPKIAIFYISSVPQIKKTKNALYLKPYKKQPQFDRMID